MLIEEYGAQTGAMLQILDENGVMRRADLLPPLGAENWLELYKLMLKTRRADKLAVSLQRQGRLLTYAPNAGQEAAQVGPAAAMDRGDWLVPAFRELGALLQRGVALEKIYLYWYGNELGSSFPAEIRVLPIAIPVGSQLPHAVGLAMAASIKGAKEVALAYVGDGGTSTGDFNEALNFAGVFQAPVVFLIQNNQYAISVPRKKQSKAATLAQKAVAAGIPGLLVDGNDLMAMYAAAAEALKRARRGGGPTLIEAYTYRLGAHTTSDDPSRYRGKEETESWRAKDPLLRVKHYLVGQGLWSEEQDLNLAKAYDQEALEVFRQVEAGGETEIEDIFKHHFQKMPKHLQKQYEEYLEYVKGGQ